VTQTTSDIGGEHFSILALITFIEYLNKKQDRQRRRWDRPELELPEVKILFLYRSELDHKVFAMLQNYLFLRFY